MYSIQLGSLVLNGELILYIAFGLAGWMAVKLLFRGTEGQGELSEIALNVILIWILVWKASLILFDPASVIQNPSQLLYFSGGAKGRWLATAIAAGYAIYRMYKSKTDIKLAGAAVTGYLLGGWAVYKGILALLDSENGFVHLNYATAATVLYTGLYIYRHRTRWKNALIVLAAAGLAVFAIHDAIGNPPPTAVSIGQTAPDFELINIEGESVQLSDYRGQTVLLNFWATWCPPCRAEMPHLQKFHEEHAQEDIVVLGVNLTTTEKGMGIVGEFVESRQLTLPIALDVDGQIMSIYQVRAYPTSYIIDPHGVIQQKFTGAIDYETMVKATEPK